MASPLTFRPHRLVALEKSAAPLTSWWTDAPRDQYFGRCVQEARRMCGSQGDKAVAKLHNDRYQQAAERVRA